MMASHRWEAALAGDGGHTIAKEMEEVKLKGLHRVRTSAPKGNVVDAILEIHYRRTKVLPPIGKQSRYRALSLTVIHASERDTPANRKPIEWKLITDLPVTSRREAIEKLDWYVMRWKIETFHKILKSGCNAEESRLRTAERLANLISVFFHNQLAHFLANHAQPDLPQCRARDGTDAFGN